uniref:Wsv037-like protein n=1 Tax=Metapenaeus joyneri majanivirus TaxID=2984280 RepID=A0A9C7C6I9_9VIRU|nr:MAG: wsv037-like protein [Metapenaeus joyneri majanivirus]
MEKFLSDSIQGVDLLSAFRIRTSRESKIHPLMVQRDYTRSTAGVSSDLYLIRGGGPSSRERMILSRDVLDVLRDYNNSISTVAPLSWQVFNDKTLHEYLLDLLVDCNLYNETYFSNFPLSGIGELVAFKYRGGIPQNIIFPIGAHTVNWLCCTKSARRMGEVLLKRPSVVIQRNEKENSSNNNNNSISIGSSRNIKRVTRSLLLSTKMMKEEDLRRLRFWRFFYFIEDAVERTGMMHLNPFAMSHLSFDINLVATSPKNEHDFSLAFTGDSFSRESIILSDIVCGGQSSNFFPLLLAAIESKTNDYFSVNSINDMSLPTLATRGEHWTQVWSRTITSAGYKRKKKYLTTTLTTESDPLKRLEHAVRLSNNVHPDKKKMVIEFLKHVLQFSHRETLNRLTISSIGIKEDIEELLLMISIKQEWILLHSILQHIQFNILHIIGYQAHRILIFKLFIPILIAIMFTNGGLSQTILHAATMLKIAKREAGRLTLSNILNRSIVCANPVGGGPRNYSQCDPSDPDGLISSNSSIPFVVNIPTTLEDIMAEMRKIEFLQEHVLSIIRAKSMICNNNNNNKERNNTFSKRKINPNIENIINPSKKTKTKINLQQNIQYNNGDGDDDNNNNDKDNDDDNNNIVNGGGDDDDDGINNNNNIENNTGNDDNTVISTIDLVGCSNWTEKQKLKRMLQIKYEKQNLSSSSSSSSSSTFTTTSAATTSAATTTTTSAVTTTTTTTSVTTTTTTVNNSVGGSSSSSSSSNCNRCELQEQDDYAEASKQFTYRTLSNEMKTVNLEKLQKILSKNLKKSVNSYNQKYSNDEMPAIALRGIFNVIETIFDISKNTILNSIHANKNCNIDNNICNNNNEENTSTSPQNREEVEERFLELLMDPPCSHHKGNFAVMEKMLQNEQLLDALRLNPVFRAVVGADDPIERVIVLWNIVKYINVTIAGLISADLASLIEQRKGMKKILRRGTVMKQNEFNYREAGTAPEEVRDLIIPKCIAQLSCISGKNINKQNCRHFFCRSLRFLFIHLDPNKATETFIDEASKATILKLRNFCKTNKNVTSLEDWKRNIFDPISSGKDWVLENNNLTKTTTTTTTEIKQPKDFFFRLKEIIIDNNLLTSEISKDIIEEESIRMRPMGFYREPFAAATYDNDSSSSSSSSSNNNNNNYDDNNNNNNNNSNNNNSNNNNNNNSNSSSEYNSAPDILQLAFESIGGNEHITNFTLNNDDNNNNNNNNNDDYYDNYLNPTITSTINDDDDINVEYGIDNILDDVVNMTSTSTSNTSSTNTIVNNDNQLY